MSPLLLLVTLLPTVGLFLYIFFSDSYEKEPFPLLLLLFAGGMAGIIPAMIYELAFGAIGALLLGGEETVPYIFYDNFLVVAVAEEGVKLLATMIIAWKSRHFNYRFDAIVYAVTVSLGFATVENILYVAESGMQTAIMRAILAVPSHAIDAVFMGYFLGTAKFLQYAGDRKGSRKNILLAYLVPIIIHGFYDFCLSMENGFFIVLFIGFVIVIDIFAVLRVRKASKRNTLIIPETPAADNSATVQTQVPPQGYTVPVQAQTPPQGYTVPIQAQTPPQGHTVPIQAQTPPQGHTVPVQAQTPPQGHTVPVQAQTPLPGGEAPAQVRQPLSGDAELQPHDHIYCIHCGKKMSVRAFYCTSCGKPLHRI